MNPTRWLALLLFLFLTGGCSVPFSTASGEWKIRYDRKAVREKESVLAQPATNKQEGRPPNIVLIVVDDLGKFDVSAYGGKTISTPHIDQFGVEGIRFRDAYVSSPVCSPSRAGMLTGRYQGRFGFETQPMEYYPNNLAVYWLGKNVMNTDEWVVTVPPRFPAEWELQRQGLPPSEINLAELLKTRGYRTASIGKWHLGYSPRLTPNNRGFDYQYGFYGAFSLYTPRRNTKGYVNYPLASLSSRHQWQTGRRGTSAIRRNGRVVKERDYFTFALRDEAIRWIDQNRDQPFFLYLGFTAPHEPFQAPQAYYDRFAHITDKGKRVYYAMVAALDDAVGAVQQRLKTLGLDENTLIFFISDNGAASYTHVIDNVPYKGGKLTMFEGGVNVPFFVKWPARLPAGRVFETPVSALDVFTTAAAAAGCKLPDDRPYDGLNLLPYLSGESAPSVDRAFYWKADHIQAMRRGEWKFLQSTRDGWVRLYHIGEDRYEEYELESEKPEVLRRLLDDYRQWEQQLAPPLWPRLMDHLFMIDGQRYLFPA